MSEPTPRTRRRGRPLGRHGAAALRYAARGWAVFPLQPAGKQPRTRHGLHDATSDRRRIRAWWAACPTANIGLATGRLVVLDVDGEEGRASLAALEGDRGPLPPTLRALTARGAHLYFLAPPGPAIPNSAGRLGRGLDVRGEGGYVVAPPSVHPDGGTYRWASRATPAMLPEHLAASLRHAPTRARDRAPLPTALRAGDRAERYLLAALEGECDAVAEAKEGTRNDTLNRAAFRLGQLSAAVPGFADDATLTAALLDAADAAGLGETEAVTTIASGLRAGHENPRPLPDSPSRRRP
ncbi:MAG: bifunctional DNA primase/polymerase [Proteobacteria bacterium]|nr:bifunctional DNA primase/polymerase [Pseudomonadota bacterium]